MGMDVNGINPVIVGDSPEWPGNNATESEMNAYFEAKNTFRQNNPGDYFRANCWSWRPLMAIMEMSGALDCLPDTQAEHMNYNDGAGARTKKQAKDMASCVREWVIAHDWKWESILDLDNPERGEFYYEPNWGDSMVNEEGRFLSEEEAKDPSIPKRSAYRIYRPHVEEWVLFLENCGDGFEVW